MNINNFSYSGSIVLIAVIIVLGILYSRQRETQKFLQLQSDCFVKVAFSETFMAFLHALIAQKSYEKKYNNFLLASWNRHLRSKYANLAEHCYQRMLDEFGKLEMYDRQYELYCCIKDHLSILFQWGKVIKEMYEMGKVPDELVIRNKYAYIIHNTELSNIFDLIQQKMLDLFIADTLIVLKNQGLWYFNQMFRDQRSLFLKNQNVVVFQQTSNFKKIFISLHANKVKREIKDEIHRMKSQYKTNESLYEMGFSKFDSLDILSELDFSDERKLIHSEKDALIEKLLISETNVGRYEYLLKRISNNALREKLKQRMKTVIE